MMRIPRVLSIVTIIFSLYFFSPVLAMTQGNTWIGANLTQMVEAARWKLGVLRYNAALEILNAGYDTDIYYGYIEPTPDWTFSVGVPIQVILPVTKKVLIDISERPEYLFYLETERERAWNNVFNGRIHFALDRVYFQAGGGLSNVRRRFSPEIDINLREKRDDLNSLLLWQFSKRTSLAFSYEWSRYDYGDQEIDGTSLAAALARQEHLLDVVGFVQPNSRLRLFLDAQYGSYVFDNEAPIARGSRSHGVFGGVEFIPRVGELIGATGIRGGFRIGYQRLDLIDPRQEDGEGISGEGNVTFDLTKKTSARFFYSRGFIFSVYGGAAFYLNSSFGAGLSQRLSRMSTLSYNASFGRTTYPGDAGALGAEQRFLSHSASLDFRLSRLLNMSFFATLGRRSLPALALPFNRNFFGINLTYGYPGAGMASPIGGLAR